MSNITIGKKRFPLAEAEAIALKVLEQLKPYCIRAEVVGSIRRKKADCGDIDICLLLKPDEIGLFQNGIAQVINQWKKIKGKFPGKYIQIILPEGIMLDLYFTTEQNWGHLVTIRTGSCEFSKCLGKRWVACGYKSVDGYLTKGGQLVEVREEKDLFKILGLDYVEPENRNL